MMESPITTIASITSVTPVPLICNIPFARIVDFSSLLYVEQTLADGGHRHTQEFCDLFGSQRQTYSLQDLDHFATGL